MLISCLKYCKKSGPIWTSFCAVIQLSIKHLRFVYTESSDHFRHIIASYKFDFNSNMIIFVNYNIKNFEIILLIHIKYLVTRIWSCLTSYIFAQMCHWYKLSLTVVLGQILFHTELYIVWFSHMLITSVHIIVSI